MDTKEFEALEEAVAYEILTAIRNDEGNCPALQQIQPPESVMKLAADAAAKILLAFEHGYQMGE
jgi:hypothetical protein